MVQDGLFPARQRLLQKETKTSKLGRRRTSWPVAMERTDRQLPCSLQGLLLPRLFKFGEMLLVSSWLW